MSERRIRERCIEFFREHATLRGYRLVFNKIALGSNEGYANIEEADSDSIIEGALYGIYKEDRDKLDRYEGYPHHYYRKDVCVELGSGSMVKAFTYIANPDKIHAGLRPSKEYLSYLLEACDILSKEYCEKLKNIETL